MNGKGTYLVSDLQTQDIGKKKKNRLVDSSPPPAKEFSSKAEERKWKKKVAELRKQLLEKKKSILLSRPPLEGTPPAVVAYIAALEAKIQDAGRIVELVPPAMPPEIAAQGFQWLDELAGGPMGEQSREMENRDEEWKKQKKPYGELKIIKK